MKRIKEKKYLTCKKSILINVCVFTSLWTVVLTHMHASEIKKFTLNKFHTITKIERSSSASDKTIGPLSDALISQNNIELYKSIYLK